METREYVEYLLKNYREILKDIEQLKFEYKVYKDIEENEVIESLNFSSVSDEKIQSNSVSDKTCKIALIYKEAAKRMNKESREEIYKMIKVSELEISRLNYCIDRLEPNIREVVKEMFFEGLQWKDISRKNSVSEKTLNNYRKKGIDEIVSMFDLRRLAI
ncbi:hypothetical protein AGR56_04240 [Clostridium sp. DMHC 10]|uniref:hypothetical protein n=1 Tax=Clostridium sp. DMHC 10 TaxID=747377 RepID=UPI00069DD959|nr:hypothetical protein [Clostridium sp. DMHC 10]KOF56135.1 hypothetical protein AGR56_04240 [Clostridium sp. DMHC 10]